MFTRTARSFTVLLLLGIYAFIPAATITSGPTPNGASDQTLQLQKIIAGLAPNGVLDCGGQTYTVVALQLKSNITIQNCSFETLPGSVDFAAPITIDGRSSAISNIVLRNIHVDGNRHFQTNIGYAGQEDGGRHCFRILGNVSNLVIENSVGKNCASDGIALVSYGVSTSDENLPFHNITVRNSSFASNRRHGGSADGISSVTFDNVTFSQNGTTVPGGAEGDQCASSGGSCYGSGFWYEDYTTSTAGEGLNDLLFTRCVFRANFQRSLFFFARSPGSVPGFQARGPIRILNSFLDSGIKPLTEDYAIQFQVDDALVGQGAAFQNVLIQNSELEGSVGFRQVANVTTNLSNIKTTIPYLGYSAYSTQFVFENAQTDGKLLAASFDPMGANAPLVTYMGPQTSQTYSTGPPQAGTFSKGDVVWNLQSNSSVLGWICVSAGSSCLQWQSF